MRTLVPRIALLALIGLQVVRPFTLLNQHDSGRILIGAVLIGILFFALLLLSFRMAKVAYGAALVLFVSVVLLAAITGASPFLAGVLVKVVLVTALGYGFIAISTTSLRAEAI